MKNCLRTFGMVAVAALMCVGIRTSAVAQDTNSQAGSDMSRNTMKMSSADRKFMMTAATGGMAEVEMARLALQKSGSDSVKQYAQKMLDDHTAANNERLCCENYIQTQKVTSDSFLGGDLEE